MIIQSIQLSEPNEVAITGVDLFGSNAQKINILGGRTTIETGKDPAAPQDASWNFFLDQPTNVFRITFLNTNGHKVKCFDASNKLLYHKVSKGGQTLQSLTNFSATLEPYYNLGGVVSKCVNNVQYDFVPCYDTNLEKCPANIYTPIPSEISKSLDILNPDKARWDILKRKTCNDEGNWTDCFVADKTDGASEASSVRKRICQAPKNKRGVVGDVSNPSGCQEIEEKCKPNISDWGEWLECIDHHSSRKRTCTENGYKKSCASVTLIEVGECSDFIMGDFGPCQDGKSLRACTPGFNSSNGQCPIETKICPPESQGPGISNLLPILIPLVIVVAVALIALIFFLRKRNNNCC
jgi:hypothetical protein